MKIAKISLITVGMLIASQAFGMSHVTRSLKQFAPRARVTVPFRSMSTFPKTKYSNTGYHKFEERVTDITEQIQHERLLAAAANVLRLTVELAELEDKLFAAIVNDIKRLAYRTKRWAYRTLGAGLGIAGVYKLATNKYGSAKK